MTREQIAAVSVVQPQTLVAAMVVLATVGYGPRTRDRHRPERWLLLLIAFLAQHAGRLAGEMARGEIPIEEFQLRMVELVRTGYAAAAILGAERAFFGEDGGPSFGSVLVEHGPIVASGSTLRDRVERTLATETAQNLAALERFARTVEAEYSVTTTEDAAVARGQLYGHYATAVFELARREERRDAGATAEMNLLNAAAEHCVQCAELSRRGWVPIGSLPVPGKRICSARCKCRLAYR